MRFQNWWIRARLALAEARDAAARALRTDDFSTESLDFSRLESRILLSASPMPVDAAQVGLVAEPELATIMADADDANLADEGAAAATTSDAQDTTSTDDVRTPDDSLALLDQLSETLDATLADESQVRYELVFVDEGAADYEQLVADLTSQQNNGKAFEVLVLDSARDGIEQISEALAERRDVDAIHIVSHGTDRAVKLGNLWLTADNVEAYQPVLSGWRDSLAADADLLFYGCDLANGEEGQAILSAFAAETGADVAASNDDTGAAALGGDWDLEYALGRIDTATAFSSALETDWDGLLNTFTVINTSNSGAGSFRQAIIDANALAGTDTISFNITGTGLHTITVTSVLPTITDTVIINGYSESDAQQNTLSTGTDAVLRIELNGNSMNVAGLTLGAGSSGSTIQGLSIVNFDGGTSGVGILIQSSNNIIAGNYVGIRADGTTALGNSSDQIYISGSVSGNLIGGTTPSARNVISGGTSGDGVQIYNGANNNTIRGNYIGTDASGTLDRGNSDDGIDIDTNADNNSIIGNVISGNNGDGIDIGDAGTDSGSTIIQGNFIGTAADGRTALGNSAAGIQLGNGSTANNTSIGGTGSGEGNTIAYNTSDGIRLTASTGVTILGNSIHSNGSSDDLGIDLGANSVTANDSGDADTGANNLQNYPILTSAITDQTGAVRVSGTLNSTASTNFRIEFFSNQYTDASGYGEGQKYLGYVNVVTNGSGNATFNTELATAVPVGFTISATATKLTAGLVAVETSEFSTTVSTIGNASLWMSSTSNATTSAASGALSYNDGQVVRFGDPDLGLGSTTGGNFSQVFDIDDFASDGNADINGLHYVSRAVTVGTTNAVSLQAGDILLTTGSGETLGGVAVTTENIVLFRPTTVGDYSAGTFSVLIRNPGNTGNNLRDFALVERAMTVGGTSLQAGDFLMLISSGTYDKDVSLFRPTTMSTNPTGGTLSNFVDGGSSGISFASQIYGLEFVQESTFVGGYSLTAGQLLVQVDGSENVGSNSLAVTNYDIFRLNVTATGSGTSSGTAAMFMDGSDVSLSSGGEENDAIALVGAYNTAAVNSVPGSQSTNEDTSLVFSSGNGNLISITDADAGNGQMEASLSVTNGLLTLAGTSGLTFTSGDGTSDSTMTFRGTVANINTALNGLSFAPTANYSGSATLTLASVDTALVTVNIDVNLEARYTFDNTSDLGNDSSPYGENDGTGVNIAAVADGTRGQVMDFDGSGDYVQIDGMFDNPDDFTLATWVKVDAGETTGHLIVMGDNIGLSLESNGGGEYAHGFYYDGTNWLHTAYSTASLANTGWHHLAYTHDGANDVQVLYLDGVAVGRTTNTANISWTLGSDTFLGKHGDGSTSWDFDGLLDDARIYTRALTSSQIAALASDLNLDDSDNVAITVNPVNDAPTITNGATVVLTGTNEDTTSSGTTANTLLTSASWADVDSSPLKGIAITSKSGNGTWQYSTDGATWASFGAVSSSNALLITSTTQVRYIPDGSNGESATFEFKAWDQTSGTASTNGTPSYANPGSGGGATAYSSSSATGSITVTSLNDAPQLNNTKSPALTSQNEDSGAPAGAVGTLISSLVDFASPTGQVDNVTDVDTTAVMGIAITAADTSNGTWYYSTNNGTNWNALGAVGNASARLLAADANTRIYFQPNANYNGTQAGAITFRAWDTTSGTHGSLADTSTNGGTSAFSTATDTASLTITSINDDPTITSNGGGATASINVAENATAVTTVVSSDIDGGTPAYSITGGADSAQFAIDGSTGALTFQAARNYESPADANLDNVYQVTVQISDGAGGFDSQTISVTITDVDEFNVTAPTDVNATANSVQENATTGSVVNITASANDADGTTNAVTYSLTDNAGGRFTIDANSGVVTVANGTLLNREAAASHNITVRATSADSSTADTVFTINVNDVDEFDVSSPADANAAANAVNENVANGTTVGITASASDTDATTNAVSYSLTSDAGGRFAIHATTGVVTVADGTLLNREAAASHNITVRATSTDTSTADTVFTININDVDEFDVTAVNDSNATANSAAEGAVVGTAVGVTASASDADATTNAITYSLDDSAGGLFAIHASTGVVTVNGALDYETATSHNITVRATSADTSFATQVFTIQVTDANESGVFQITDSDAAANLVLENAANSTTVGLTALSTDSDPSDSVTYSLDDNAGGRFTIDTNTGVVTVANSGLLNREAAGSHDIIVRATSTDTSTITQSFTISIGDVDEFDVSAPADVNAAANAVDENATNGTVIDITAGASDADATTNAITYSLDNSAGGRFAIDGSTGVVTVADGTLLDREAAASHNITVRATSSDTSFSTAVFTISLNDVDEFDTGAVSDSNLAANTVNENAANGTTVGVTAFSFDLDITTHTITYSLDDSAGGRFAIHAATGVVSVADGTLLNREAAASHNITVRATSSDASFSTAVFTINLNDINEFNVTAPTDVNAVANAVAENATNGTVIDITASASDADATTNGVTYSLFDNAGGRFTIDTNSGVVTVADGTLLNREAAASHNITVRATSADGSTADSVFTITVTDVDEFDVTAPSDVNAVANAVAENATNGTVVDITASASDADATTNGVTYSLTDNAGGRFAIDANSGVVTVADGTLLNREAAASHDITVRASSADGSTADTVFTVNVTDVDEFDVSAPADLNAAANAVAENATNGTVIDITASASDADATTNGVTFSLTDNAGGRFAVDTNSGVVTVADGTLLNREVAASHNITVRATSADGSTADTVFTITVTDVNEFDVTAPADGNAAANTVAENATNGTVIDITASASDADATTNSVTYSLMDSAGGRFAIDTNSGLITVADGTLLNREAAASHNITVRATSADGSTADTVFTITVTDVNEFDVTAPSDVNAVANAVAENASNGTVIDITANASDADATTNGVTYSLLDSAGGRFTIDGNTGVVTVADGTLLNREAAASHDITVRATSADGSTADTVFTISVTDVDEFDVPAPTDTDATANAVNENAANGTTVGVTASASDADATTNTITYSLDDNAGGRFVIHGSTGVVTVADGTLLDREAAPSYDIVVRATSADTSFNTQAFTISLNSLNDNTPVIISNGGGATATVSLVEGSIAVTDVTATDADLPAETLTYTITGGADASKFTINSSTGALSFVTAPDFEAPADAGANNVYDVTVLVSDGSFTDSQVIAVEVTNDTEPGLWLSTKSNATAGSETWTDGTVMRFADPNLAFGAGTTSGTFSQVFDIDNFTQDGNADINGIHLVRRTVVIGTVNSITVNAGDVLFSVTANETIGGVATTDKDVMLFRPTTPNDYSSGTFTRVLTQLGSGDKVRDFALVETAMTIGGTALQAGDFLIVLSSASYDKDISLFRPTDLSTSPTSGAFSEFIDGQSAGISFNQPIFGLDLVDRPLTLGGQTLAAGQLLISVDGNDTVGSNSHTTSAYDIFTLTVTGTGTGTSSGTAARLMTGGDVGLSAGGEQYDALTLWYTANANPTITSDGGGGNVSLSFAENTTAVTTVTATDADLPAQSLTYTISGGADAAQFTIHSSTGVLTFVSAQDFETPTDAGGNNVYDVTVQVSDGSLIDTQAISVTITDVDEFDVGAISDTNGAANAVNEDAANGTAVGITASASDADATTNGITYSLDDSAGGRFAINSSTGVVTVADGTLLDREAAASHNIIIRATSVDTSFGTQSFTINVTDVDEFDVTAPADVNVAANTVAENATNGTVIDITAAASDADATNNTVTYSLFDNAGGRFAINANSGVVTVADGTLLNREAAASHSITVRATSADGSTADTAFTLNVNDVDEFDVSAPADADATTNGVSENATTGTTAGITAAANDTDATTNAVTYSLTDNAGGRFAIDATSGVVTVADGTLINREATASHNITVRATSADGSTADSVFIITINDVDEFNVSSPTDTNAVTNAVDENAANGTVVGITASASDADATTNAVTYSLIDNAGGRFDIDTTSGVVTVADGTLLNREAAASHNITVRATSTDGSTADMVFTINVNDIDEFDVTSPTEVNATVNAVNENAANGIAVGLTASASDADATTNGVTYSLTDNAGGRFTIDVNTGVVIVADSTLLNREAAASHNITVRATSADGSTADTIFTINVNDVDEFDVSTPADGDATANAVSENAANGTSVGITATASDVDATTNGVTYSLTNNAGGRFAIGAMSGVVTVSDGTLLNREAAASHNITVRATSADGSTADTAFTISINDVDEFDVTSPSDSNAATNAIDEHAANGTTVGITASASDVDATTNGVTYSLTNDAGGRFAIDANAGVVTVGNGTLLNREVAASHNITVRATSADGSTADTVFTVSINDVDEFDVSAPTDTNASANAVNENAANGTVVGIAASANDADATTNGVTFSLADSAGGRFTIDANSGVVTVADGTLLNREVAASHNITVRAISADGSTADTVFTISVTDVDEFDVTLPTDTNATANAVSENAANGSVVNITANASDADATTNGVAYSLTDNAGGRFAINTNSGVVTVADGTLLNREVATSHNITVRATSADGSTADTVFTINVTDVDEFDVTTPADVNAAANLVSENATNGTVIDITASASDADATTNGVTYSLTNNAGGRFAIDVNTGVVIVADSTLLNREAAASHNITVRATSADGSTADTIFTVNVNDVDEFDVSAPADGDATANAVSENAANGISVGIAATASDVDATTNGVSYSLADSAGGRFAIGATSGVVTVADGTLLNREAAASHNITVRATSADGSTADTVFTININDVDEFNVTAPTDVNAVANAVNENAANGSVVNITASASDADATTNGVTYSLTNDAGGRFAINTNSGVVTVADGTLLNLEIATSHNITVRATSADGSTADTVFTINVTDVDEFDVTAPSDVNAAANSVNENANNGTLIDITASASDADATTNGVTYSLTDNAGGRFAINTNSGVVTVADGTLLNRESAASHNITVRATSADGSTADTAFTISINDVDEFDVTLPTDANASANVVNENAANGTVVGITASANDADATTNGVTYSLTNSAGGRFAIDANSGVVTVADSTLLNREVAASHDITVRAISADGSIADTVFTISVTDVDEFDVSAPADTNAAANAIHENAANGSTVGVTASASDADATTNAVTFSLTDDAGGRFAIDSNSGVITVADGTLLNREAAASHNITIRATSADGSTADTVFTININDVDEFNVGAVSDSNGAADAVAENAAIGTEVGITAAATDADATTNAISYSLDDNAGGRFAIDGSSGIVTMAAALDYETATSHGITVRATSADGSFSTQVFTIQVTDFNETGVGPISDVDATTNLVLENATNGTSVGLNAFSADLDGTDTITYSLDDDAGGRFAIDVTSGVVTVADGTLLNREMAASYNVVVRATSSDTSTTTAAFAILIGDVNEFDVSTPTDATATSNAVNENAANGTAVGITASASDADATTNGVTYSLTDNAGGRFTIDGNTGVVTVADGALLNHEAASSHNITVRATSTDGSTADSAFTISINDVDEFDVTAPTDANATANAVNENASTGTAAGIIAAASDADATTNGVTYSLTDNAGGRFAIDVNSGVVTVADGTLLNREAAASHNITVRATSADGSTADSVFTINVTDVDEFDVAAPTDTDAVANAIDENAANGTVVGIAVTASDADATTNVVTYSLTDNAGGRFAIDANSGVVTVADGTLLNHDVAASHNITVRATSADGSTADTVFTIAVNGVNNDSPIITSNGGGATAAVSLTENTAVVTTVTATDADLPAQTLTYSIVGGVDAARFAIDSATGALTFLSAPDFEAPSDADVDNVYEVTVQVSDDAGVSDSQAISVSIAQVNEAPSIITNTGASVAEGSSGNVVTTATLNAGDPDDVGSGLTYTIVSVTANGTLRSNGIAIGLNSTFTQADLEGGLITYDHDGSETTSDSFGFRLADGGEDNVTPTTGTFHISVTPVNDDPANAGGLPANTIVTEDTTSHIDLSALLLVDSDAGTEPLTLMLSTTTGGRLQAGSSGGVTVGGSGSGAITLTGVLANLNTYLDNTSNLQYLHGVENLNGNDVDSILVVVTDNAGSADILLGSVNVDITSVNDAPTSINLTANQVYESAAPGTLIGTAATTDPDAGETYTYDLTDDAAGRFAMDASTGDLTVVDGSRLDFETASSYAVTIRVTDSGGLTHSETFTINVRDFNESPTAQGETYTMLQFGSLTISPPAGVLANDQDVDGDALAAVLVSDVSHGTLSLNADGTFVYVPDATFSGIDSFTYLANDGSLTSAPITVTITVEAVAPAAPPSSGGNSEPSTEEPVETEPVEEPVDDSQPEAELPATEQPPSPTAPPAAAPVVGRDPTVAVPPNSTLAETAQALDEAAAVATIEGIESEVDAATRFVRSALRGASHSTSLNGALTFVPLRPFVGAVANAPISLFMPNEEGSAAAKEESQVATNEIVLGTTTVVSTALSVGYVVWLVRGGSLVASLAASMPAWTSFDPLPILQSFEDSQNDPDKKGEESLCDLVSQPDRAE